MFSGLSGQSILHYFQNMLAASGGFVPKPHRGCALGPRWGTEPPDLLICPPLGAHDCLCEGAQLPTVCNGHCAVIVT